MDDDKKIQVKKMAAVLAGIIPPAARISLGWAEKLYEHGLRIHPELAHKAAVKTPLQEAYTPEVQNAAQNQAMATLQEMAGQWPWMQPLVTKVQNARTPEERAAAANELRRQIPDDLIQQAQAQAGLIGDVTE